MLKNIFGLLAEDKVRPDWVVNSFPVNNERNNALYEKYKELALKEKNVLFGGRLGQYKYYDMDKVIEAAWEMCEAQN